MIDEAKRAAASANNTAADTMDKLDDIKKEVEKISVTPGSTNLDSVLNEVDNSGVWDGAFFVVGRFICPFTFI